MNEQHGLRPRLIRCKINDQYVRIPSHSVEHNVFAIWGDIEGPHYRGISQPTQAS